MEKISPVEINLADQAASQLRQEYEAQRALFRVQPTMVQRFLETQARQLAEAILQKSPQMRFKLPDRVVLESSGTAALNTVPVPDEFREPLNPGKSWRQVISGQGSGSTSVNWATVNSWMPRSLSSAPGRTSSR